MAVGNDTSSKTTSPRMRVPVEDDRRRALVDVHRQVQVLEDPVEQRQRGLHVDLHVQQRHDRAEQARLERREGHHGPDRDRRADPRLAGEPVDRGRHQREADPDRGHHPPAGHPLAHLEVGQALGLALEALGQGVGAAHRLAEQDARDRQGLLDDARHVGDRLLARGS